MEGALQENVDSWKGKVILGGRLEGSALAVAWEVKDKPEDRVRDARGAEVAVMGGSRGKAVWFNSAWNKPEAEQNNSKDSTMLIIFLKIRYWKIHGLLWPFVPPAPKTQGPP